MRSLEHSNAPDRLHVIRYEYERRVVQKWYEDFTIGLEAFKIKACTKNHSNPSSGRRRSGGRGLAVELWLKALESWMENAKGGQFIRNGSERAGC